MFLPPKIPRQGLPNFVFDTHSPARRLEIVRDVSLTICL